jgi:PRTRC genetic system protein E
MKQDNKGSITVFLTPKSISEDSALKALKPIYLTGTPQDIDLEFFQIISKPLEDTQKVFSNIEAFEAQKAEILKATEEKKNVSKNKKAEKTTDDNEDEDENNDSLEKPTKEIKVNNEKALKDFVASIKNDNLIDHKEKLKELIANLSITESIKPAIKKIVSDLETSIKKEESIAIAKAKFGFTTSPSLSVEQEETIEEEIISAPLTTKESFSNKEKTNDLEELKEIVVNSPNVIIATIPGPETVLPKIEPVPEPIQAPILPAPIYYTEEIDVLEMIDQTHSYEQYIQATWTDELLVQAGKAKWTKVQVQKEVIQSVDVPAPNVPDKLSYVFPKPFDQD